MGILLAEVARAEKGGIEDLLSRNWLTTLLIIVNVLIFAASLASGGALIEAGAKALHTYFRSVLRFFALKSSRMPGNG